MNRRDFLRLLGLAPLVPLAAKLKPFLPKEEARCDTFMGFRFVRTELPPENTGVWALPENYHEQFDRIWRETMRTQELKYAGAYRKVAPPFFSMAIGDTEAPIPPDVILADFKA